MSLVIRIGQNFEISITEYLADPENFENLE